MSDGTAARQFNVKEGTMRSSILRIVAVILAVAIGWSCVSWKAVPREQYDRLSITKTVSVMTKSYPAAIEFAEVHVAGDQLVGIKEDGAAREIPLADIVSIKVKRVDYVAPLLICAGLAAATVAIIISASTPTYTPPPSAYGAESCPFVFSYDGKDFVFDADPYGGAFCRGMERSEWAVLDHLRAIDGRYRLVVSNELDESEFLDEISLLVVDHPAGVRIVPEVQGRLHAVAAPIPPIRAVDQAGRDIRPLVAAPDDLAWESSPEGRDPENEADLRDTLILEFPKPKSADKATLVANAWTTVWGSEAVRRSLGLFGDRLPDWYAELNQSAEARRELLAWFLNGGMYTTRILVETRDGWKPKGLLYGGGPYMSKDKSYTLDVSDVPGDILRIKLEPAAGFWRLNYLAVDYGADVPIRVAEIHPDQAVDREGCDVRDLLAKPDQQFATMPATRDRVDLSFAAPDKPAGLERTLILKARGYYEVHAHPQGPSDPELARRMIREPALAVRHALESCNPAPQRRLPGTRPR